MIEDGGGLRNEFGGLTGESGGVMKGFAFVLLVGLLLGHGDGAAVELTLRSPLDYQIVQRSSPAQGSVRVAGEFSEALPDGEVLIEASFRRDGDESPWIRVPAVVEGRSFSGNVLAPAGGWWRMVVRVLVDGNEHVSGEVVHVGVGELFVVAGQSNSANHGEERQRPASGLVATFDGTVWRLADDPQPGASGNGGSFMPPLGDAIVAKESVPVGFIACGIGATSVREWLPQGAVFPNPPTIESRVSKRDDGMWVSNGAAYDDFIKRIKPLGVRGFRAVLWHQGESDANQKDPSRTLPGNLYREYLERLIRDSRRDIGWDAPWFVAQASYHVPGDEGSDDIRAAQSSLWNEGVALRGPDSDALKGKLRERDGQGVHFSGAGLRAHAAKWAEAVLPWIEAEWTAPKRGDGGTTWASYELLPESHSIGWVRANVQTSEAGRWDGVLDEAKWGTPSPQQAVTRNWDWRISDEAWAAAVREKGAGVREEVRTELYVPDGVDVVKGVVVISGHGSGESLFRRKDLREIAGELKLAIFKFVGNPVQRGFWPQGMLDRWLDDFGKKSDHPELVNAPLFLYGHSNGTGFSAVYPAYRPERVWGWVSMRPGVTFQVYQPSAARVPGLVIFGEEDHFLARPSREENLAVVQAMRKRHGALWGYAVEPRTGHAPGEKTWPLVFSFLRQSFAARVPADADPRGGVVKLRGLEVESGHLGTNWDSGLGGYQDLAVGPDAEYAGERETASWLVNGEFAADWRSFQRDGEVQE